MDLQEMDDIPLNATRRKKIKHLCIITGAPSDLTRRIVDCDVLALVEKYWSNKSLHVSYDKIMTKQGEDQNPSIQKASKGEKYVKSLFESIGYVVTFPDVRQTSCDLIIHTLNATQINVQVKYTSYQVWRERGEDPYKVSLFKDKDQQVTFDMLVVCVQNKESNGINWIYCIPPSGLIQEKIMTSTNDIRRTYLMVYPNTEINSNDKTKLQYKYISFNRFILSVSDCVSEFKGDDSFVLSDNVRDGLEQLLQVAIKEKYDATTTMVSK